MNFELTGEEETKYKKWIAKHDKKCPLKNHEGAIGGRLTFSFTPTGLGLITEVRCGCGGKINLTDCEQW